MSNFRTKYLKIACNLLWAVFLLIFVFAFLPKLLIYFMPFVVGMIFAMIANPMVKFLEKRIKINRKYGSVIMIVLVIGLVVLACYGAGAVLAKGIGAFMAYLPTMSANAGTEFSEAINQLQQLLDRSVFLDRDWCWDAHPFQVTEETREMVLENISFLLNSFLRCSAYDHVIF